MIKTKPFQFLERLDEQIEIGRDFLLWQSKCNASNVWHEITSVARIRLYHSAFNKQKIFFRISKIVTDKNDPCVTLGKLHLEQPSWITKESDILSLVSVSPVTMYHSNDISKVSRSTNPSLFFLKKFCWIISTTFYQK